MLELRPNCERCDRDLPPESTEARICSFECTFCAECVGVLENVCPNCGGGFERRPVRPATEWREGVSRKYRPPSTERRRMKHGGDDLAAHIARVRDVPPAER